MLTRALKRRLLFEAVVRAVISVLCIAMAVCVALNAVASVTQAGGRLLATHLIVSAVANTASGSPFTVVVEARDDQDTVDTGFSGVISIDADAVGGSNFIGGTVSASAVSGIVTFSGLQLNDAADNYVLMATSDGLDGTSNFFNVTASGPLVVTFSSPFFPYGGASVRAGAPFTLSIEARDANGSRAENFTSSFTVHAAALGGSDFANPAGGSMSNGYISTDFTLSDAANGYLATVSASGLSGTSGSFDVLASRFVFDTVANVASGTPFSVVVQARDANNNLAENFSGEVYLSAQAFGGSGFSDSSNGTKIATAVAGVASYSGLVLNNAADGYQLFAITPALGPTSSFSNFFNVTESATVSIDDRSVIEGTTGASSTIAFTVRLSSPSSAIVTVDYATADGPTITGAVGGVDYVASAGTLTFPIGITTQTVSVAVIGDVTFEGDETFVVSLTSPVVATIADGQGIGTITNDDSQPSIFINDVTVTEGSAATTPAVFNVSLSNPSQTVVTVAYATANGTALSGSDYGLLTTTTLTFDPLQTTKTITVLVSGDVLNETDEIFTVNLSTPVGATIGDAQGVGAIANDDAVPTLSILDVSQIEGTALPLSAVMTVRLSAPSGQTVVASFGTVDDTAKDGNGESLADYVANAGTLVFNPGETEHTITVSLANDATREANETLFVDLQTPTNATLARARGVVTIVDDDPAPLLVLVDRAVDEPSTGSIVVTVDVLLDAASELPATVGYRTVSSVPGVGVAEAPSDYLSATGTLAFAPGEIKKTISITINSDLLREPSEIFYVELFDAVGARVGNPRSTITIRDAVIDSLQRIDALIDTIRGLGLGPVPTGVLTQTLQRVRAELAAGHGLLGCAALVATEIEIRALRSAGRLTPAQASSLLAELDFIEAWAGCNAPRIVFFTPGSGTIGTSITLSGINFTGATEIRFGGGVSSSTFTATTTTIRVTVPAGAVTGPISVVGPGGVGVSTTTFTVLPRITSFTPTSGTRGSTVTINGTGFNGAVTVKFGSVVATIVGATSTAITAVVPSTSSGSVKVTVTTTDGTSISASNFAVLTGP